MVSVDDSGVPSFSASRRRNTIRCARSRPGMPRPRQASSEAQISAWGVMVDTLPMPHITRCPSARTRPFLSSTEIDSSSVSPREAANPASETGSSNVTWIRP